MSGFRHIADHLVHQGQVVGFYDAEFETDDGQRFLRDVVRHPGAVSVVAVDGDEVLLVKQYRAPIDADLLEIPAGKLDIAGEDRAVAAARELAEEVGMQAASLEPLIDLYHSPGFCDERQWIYLATDLTPVPMARDGLEEESMEIVRLTTADTVAAVLDGRITDAKSMVGLLAAARHLGW